MKAKAAGIFLLASAAFFLSACPDVDLSGFGVRPSDSVSAAAVGPVNGFGDLRAAGASFDNASTIFTDNHGRGVNVDNVAAGMTAVVRGSLNASYTTGVASTASIERELHGPAADNAASLDSGTIRMLGRVIIVNPATVLTDAAGDDIELDQLKELMDKGNRPALAVYGSVQDNGAIRASLVGCTQDNVAYSGDVELRGTVSELDFLGRTFQVGKQAVNYNGLPSGGRVNWPSSGLSDGLVVDLRGRLEDDGGTWVVRTDRSGDRIAVSSVDLGSVSDRVALEGYILSGVYSSFELSAPGGTVRVSSDAAPSGDAFGLLKKARVRGVLLDNDGRRISASSVFVLKAPDVILEGVPGGLPVTGNTITLLGEKVKTDSFTMFRDPWGGVKDGFGLGSLSPGDIVRVIGWVDDGASITAVRLDRIGGTADRVGVQGPIASFNVSQTSLSMLGLNVNTISDRIDYYDKGVKLDDRDAFYKKLVAGMIVRVRNAVFVSASSRIDPPGAGERMKLEIVNVNR